MERALAYRVHIEWALRQLDRFGRPVSRNGAAGKLNELHLESPMGGRWSRQPAKSAFSGELRFQTAGDHAAASLIDLNRKAAKGRLPEADLLERR
jgi:hypothetical protein